MVAQCWRSSPAARVATDMEKTPFAIDHKDLIESLGKGLRVIEAFNDDRPRLSPSEVVALTLSASVDVPAKDRKVDCVGAIGLPVQMRPKLRVHMVETLLPAWCDAPRSLRAIL